MTSTGRGTRGVPRAERRAEILDAATELFGLHGHAHVSVAAIAEAAGVSKALVLSHFGGKDDLYLACAVSVAARVQPRIADVVNTSLPGFPMALDTLHATFASLRERPRDWRVLHDPTLAPDSDLQHRVTEALAPYTGLGRTGVAALMARDGQHHDPLDLEALVHLWAAVVASAMDWWFTHPDETPDTLTARFSRLVASLVS